MDIQERYDLLVNKYGDNKPKVQTVMGPPGLTGLNGDQGLTGSKGDTGAKGDTGDKGDSVVGPQGPMGPSGPSGLSGLKGDIGPQGHNGLNGPTGERGPKGNIGSRGMQGKVGPRGPKGPRGPQGVKGGGGIPDAPHDGNYYVRYIGTWVDIAEMPDNLVQVTEAYTILDTDSIIEATGTFDVTLPTLLVPGKRYNIVNAGAGTVTIKGLINGTTDFDLDPQEALGLYANSTGWRAL